MRGPSANILNNRESRAGRDCSPFGSRSLALSRFRAPQYNACVVMLVSGTHIARAACKARAKRSRSGQTWCHLGRGRVFRQRPYSVEYTRSHPNSEVKRRKARSVLGWGTAREALRVLLAFCFCFQLSLFHFSVGSHLSRSSDVAVVTPSIATSISTAVMS